MRVEQGVSGMSRKTLFTASDGKEIAYYTWIPRNEIIGVVQIVHGMAEHAMRYDHFAAKLRSKGFAVYALDLRGHGETAASDAELGYFGPEQGWQRVVDDIFELTEIIKMEHPDTSIFLFGHSMGSLLARTLICYQGEHYTAAILSGTAPHPGIPGYVGRMLARLDVRLTGGAEPNERLDSLSFGSYNKPFAPARTRFDWLSRDEEQVDAYIRDPLCGFVCSSKFFDDLLTGLMFVNSKKSLETVPKQLPLLFISGDKDPVGAMGKGVQKAASLYKKVGLAHIQVKLLPDHRHEILNELDRNEVENFLSDWMTEQLR
jgi:alpha-beta hydrolase superfamily lysophospholipase